MYKNLRVPDSNTVKPQDIAWYIISASWVDSIRLNPKVKLRSPVHKKWLKSAMGCVIIFPRYCWKERKNYEACTDIKHKKVTEHCKEGRLRRVPDLLPVSMQDFLHRRKSDLRAVQISFCLHKKDDQRDRSRCGRSFVAIVQMIGGGANGGLWTRES